MWIGKIFNELFSILFRSGLGCLNILNVFAWLIPNRSGRNWLIRTKSG
jgi:hypothetical protein